MYQMFRSQFLAFSIYQSKHLLSHFIFVCVEFFWKQFAKCKSVITHTWLIVKVFDSFVEIHHCVFQALCSFFNITTKVAAYTGYELWGKEISWTSQWVRWAPFQLGKFLRLAYWLWLGKPPVGFWTIYKTFVSVNSCYNEVGHKQPHDCKNGTKVGFYP